MALVSCQYPFENIPKNISWCAACGFGRIMLLPTLCSLSLTTCQVQQHCCGSFLSWVDSCLGYLLSLGSASTGVTPQEGALVNFVPLCNMPQSALCRSTFGLRAVLFVVIVAIESMMTVRVGQV